MLTYVHICISIYLYTLYVHARMLLSMHMLIYFLIHSIVCNFSIFLLSSPNYSFTLMIYSFMDVKFFHYIEWQAHQMHISQHHKIAGWLAEETVIYSAMIMIRCTKPLVPFPTKIIKMNSYVPSNTFRDRKSVV